MDYETAIEALRKTYRFIVLRAFVEETIDAGHPVNRNIVTSLYYVNSLAEVSSSFLKFFPCESKDGQLKFAFMEQTFDISAEKSLLESVKNGRIELSDERSYSFRPFEISNLQAHISHDHLQASIDWQLLEVVHSNEESSTKLANARDRLLGVARKNKFQGLEDMVCNFLQIKNVTSARHPNLVLALPVYCKPETPQLSSGGQFNCVVRHHSSLKFSIVSKLSKLGTKFQKEMMQIKSTPDGDFQHSALIADFSDPLPTTGDWVHSEIFLEELPELEGLSLESLWVPPEFSLNPLLRTLWKFCDPDHLLERAKVPLQVEEIKSHDRGREFERTVSWILTMLGYPNIWLGEYATTYHGKGGIGKSSWDIILYTPTNQIVLIDCTTAYPDERKAQELYVGSQSLKQQKDEIGYNGEIIPCMITSIDCPDKSVKGVSILDGQTLKFALEESARGNRHKLYFNVPTNYQL